MVAALFVVVFDTIELIGLVCDVVTGFGVVGDFQMGLRCSV